MKKYTKICRAYACARRMRHSYRPGRASLVARWALGSRASGRHVHLMASELMQVAAEAAASAARKK